MVDQVIIPVDQIVATIFEVRSKKVVIDSDLARLYGVTTKQLNQAVKRNAERFPEDFMFILTDAERTELVTNCDRFTRQKHSSALPHAFTEHGAVMAASVLNTPKAVEVSVYVVRAFIRQLALLASHAEMALKLEQLEKKLLATYTLHEDRLDAHESQLEDIIETIREMQRQHTHRPIGFRVEEAAALYSVNRKGKS